MPDVILSTKTFDLNGYLEIDLDGDREIFVERARIRTIVSFALDGSPIREDGGFTHVGRKWDVRMKPSLDALEIMKYLIETYGSVDCSIREGMFTVVPQRISTPSPLLFQFQLVVVSKDT